jgi:hypothetical protein
MQILRMTFNSQQDFTRACEHFENNSKFTNFDIFHQDMSIEFQAKNNVGAETCMYAIEHEIYSLSFEYDKFFIVK